MENEQFIKDSAELTITLTMILNINKGSNFKATEEEIIQAAQKAILVITLKRDSLNKKGNVSDLLTHILSEITDEDEKCKTCNKKEECNLINKEEKEEKEEECKKNINQIINEGLIKERAKKKKED